ncbi:hypothetical protein EGW08_010806 [Elysia chlorotica]|uniref:TRAF-type domain-containing protein n=1 Tax=Elysia chlorotica TaxID=188477 RepID=A0A433TIJ6_ELYCH|nr:hypothetical protein EGW08_010806 [Elysia chlorotica]
METGACETTFCNNCKRDISTANFVMHEMHCRRHIVLCEHCQEPVTRSEIEEHFNEFHIKLPCEKCQLTVEKDKMEQHMNSECERRPVPCEFCELSFPKNQFESHADFCGSRTECCPLCRQFVMLKDMLQHENSGCSYPPRKPSPPPQPDSNAVDLDAFSMLQMHRLLGGEDFGGPQVLPEMAPNGRRGFERNYEPPPVMGQGEGARKNGPSKNGARGARGVRREPVHKKTDVNVQRANNLSNSASGRGAFELSPDIDYDTLLALQLAHDDWLKDDQIETDGMSSEQANVEPARFETSVWSRNSSGVEQIVQDRSRQYNEEAATIPCELCEIEVPLEDYMYHVESCHVSVAAHSSLSQQDLNNEVSRQSLAADRPSIPVINNLGSPSMPRFQDFSPEIEEDFLLPCEFCEDMFPSDIIIQHQSVCQANGMATPRVTTPAYRQHQNISHQLSPVEANVLSSRPNGLHSEPSLLDFVNDLDENHFSLGCDDQQVPESTSNKYSTGARVDRFDDAVARPPRRPSKSSVSDDTVDHQTSAVAKRENSSAQRARARLNQLLQEDRDEPLAASASSRQGGTRPVRTEKKSNVDSRSVMQQLDATRVKPNKNSKSYASQSSRRSQVDSNVSRNNSSSGNSSGSGASQASGSGARSRQRANHIFSPELRLKPDHNPRPRKQ